MASRRVRAVATAVLLVDAAAMCACAPFSGRWRSRPEHLTAGELLLAQDSSSVRGGSSRAVYPPGIALTKRSEGWVPHLYNDAVKYCTIGYGHLVRKRPCDGSEPAAFLAGLTEPQGEELLVADMASSQSAVLGAVTRTLSDGQFAALCDFVFNVGSGNFLNSTLLQLVNTGEDDRVPSQFRRWVFAGGKPWPGLQIRREREIELFFDGLPEPRGGPPIDEDLSPIDIRAGERRR
jgi:lysozyme